jgi:hypothetical protein
VNALDKQQAFGLCVADHLSSDTSWSNSVAGCNVNLNGRVAGLDILSGSVCMNACTSIQKPFCNNFRSILRNIRVFGQLTNCFFLSNFGLSIGVSVVAAASKFQSWHGIAIFGLIVRVKIVAVACNQSRD